MKKHEIYSLKELHLIMQSKSKFGKPMSLAMAKRILRKAKARKNDSVGHIILTAAGLGIIKGKLFLSSNISSYISEVQGVYAKIYANAGGIYPPPAWLPALSTKINDLDNAENNVQKDAPNAVATRNTAWVLVDLAMGDVVDFVNSLARNNQPNAVLLITGANMVVIDRGVRVKEILSAKRGKLSGTANLRAKKVPYAKSYVWEYSIDGGITWITTIKITPGGNTVVTGLATLTIVHFRYYAVTTRGNTDYCNAVYCVIL